MYIAESWYFTLLAPINIPLRLAVTLQSLSLRLKISFGSRKRLRKELSAFKPTGKKIARSVKDKERIWLLMDNSYYTLLLGVRIGFLHNTR